MGFFKGGFFVDAKNQQQRLSLQNHGARQDLSRLLNGFPLLPKPAVGLPANFAQTGVISRREI